MRLVQLFPWVRIKSPGAGFVTSFPGGKHSTVRVCLGLGLRFLNTSCLRLDNFSKTGSSRSPRVVIWRSCRWPPTSSRSFPERAAKKTGSRHRRKRLDPWRSSVEHKRQDTACRLGCRLRAARRDIRDCRSAARLLASLPGRRCPRPHLRATAAPAPDNLPERGSFLPSGIRARRGRGGTRRLQEGDLPLRSRLSRGRSVEPLADPANPPACHA